MSLFDLGKTCVFSEVKARLFKDGEPLKIVRVVRRWEWHKMESDSTTTDEKGYFEFPAVFEKSVSRWLPVEIVIAQGLYIVEAGEEQKLWSNSKREPEENTEFNGKPIDLVCEMTDEMKIYKDFGSRMRTLCTWSH